MTEVLNRSPYPLADVRRIVLRLPWPPWTRRVIVASRNFKNDRRGGFTEKGGREVWLWLWSPKSRGGKPYPDADGFRSWREELRLTTRHELIHAWIGGGSATETVARFVERGWWTR